MRLDASALVVVDMQRYYLEADSDFGRFHTCIDPECLSHIHRRCAQTVLPNLQRLVAAFREHGRPVLYLRLCGKAADRSDLHHTFARAHREAERHGFPNLYPLQSDPLSEVAPDLAPVAEDSFCKTTYSVFTSAPAFEQRLRDDNLTTLAFGGLATSQCVETSARDAADRGFQVIQIEDAQADYSETTHRASLYASQAVCGGTIVETDTMLHHLP